MAMRVRHFAPALLALVAGCTTVGPDYVPPAPPAGIASNPSNAFEASPAVSQVPLPPRWWRLYDDPRLDALVERALAANTDLRVAAANLERARAILRERSEEHTSELQSLMRSSYAVFCFKKKNKQH